MATLAWDREAQERAQQQARECQRRDPDAAALLLAQVTVEQRALVERTQTPEEIAHEVAPPGGVYDPLDLYCRLARELHWRDEDMDRMDYVRFFGYVDRLAQQQQREKEETQNPQASADLPREIVEAQQQALVASLAPTPMPYVGEVVPYQG